MRRAQHSTGRRDCPSDCARASSARTGVTSSCATEPQAKRAPAHLTGSSDQLAVASPAWPCWSTAPNASSDDALGGSDAGQAGDIQALVAALGPKYPQPAAGVGLP